MKTQQMLLQIGASLSNGKKSSFAEKVSEKKDFKDVMNLQLQSSNSKKETKSTAMAEERRNSFKGNSVSAGSETFKTETLETVDEEVKITLNGEELKDEILENGDINTVVEEIVIPLEPQEVMMDDSNVMEELTSNNSDFIVDTQLESLPVEDSEVLNVCNKVIEDVKEQIKGILDLTDEELEQMLETIGATMVDLLDPIVLKQILLVKEGTDDITLFATNENLAEKLGQLEEVLGTVFQTLDEKFPEISLAKIKALIETSKESVIDVEENIQGYQEEEVDLQEQVYQTTDSKGQDNDWEIVENKKNNPNNPKLNVEEDAELNQGGNVKTKENTTDHLKTKEVEISVISSKEETTSKGQNFQQSKGNLLKDTPNNSMLEQFVQKLAVTEQENITTFDKQLVQQMHDIVEQVVEQIKVVIKPETASMELQLNPSNLGKVNLSVLAKEGVLTANLLVQSEMAKQALEGQIQILKENLINQGLKVEAVEVAVSDFNFTKGGQTDDKSQQGGRKKTSRKINLDMLSSGMEQLSEEDTLAAKVMVSNGNQVDYIA